VASDYFWWSSGAELKIHLTCKGFPLYNGRAGTIKVLHLKVLHWRSMLAGVSECSLRLVAICVGAYMRIDQYVVPAQHWGKYLLTRAAKLWYNFGAAKLVSAY